MTTPPPKAEAHYDERWLWVLFAGAWLLHLAFSLVGWDNTLLGRFEFRQVQTAMSALYFPAHGFKLDYELPLFGPPWSAPLEFPLYQASVAWFSAATGMALDPAGRLVSWLYFQLSLPAVYLLLGSLGQRRALRFLTLALLVTSPIYVFFSRFFLMESASFCFAAWFLAAALRWLVAPRAGWLILAAISGALAAALKPPTIVVFSVGYGLFSLWHWRNATKSGGVPARAAAISYGLRSAAAFAVPVLIGLAWQVHSATVRRQNPETAFLDVMFGFFSFGDLAQRLSLDFWVRTSGIWITRVTSEAGIALAVFLFAKLRAANRPVALGAFATFLSGQLIFSNLYFVHDYYFYANGLFLLLAMGLVLAGQFDDSTAPRWSRWGLPVLVIGLQLASYARVYLPAQQLNAEPTELMNVVRDLTRPDDMIVVLGQDWDASIPYYAQRRALMFISGRERDPGSIAASIARLDPAKVGAVLIYGHLRNDSTFVQQTMARLELGPTPVLLSQEQQVGIWFPKDRLPEVKDKLPAHVYATLDLVPSRPPAGQSFTLGLHDINRQREFAEMSQRPIRASSVNGFSLTPVGDTNMLNMHAPSELVFRAPPGLRVVRANFGIHEGAYTSTKGVTDGVEFVVIHRSPEGREAVLFDRFLDPVGRAADQGTQKMLVPIDRPLAGEIIFRTLPGPNNNASYDWAYMGHIELK